MKPSSIAVLVCLALSVAPLPASALAGGPLHGHRGSAAHGAVRPHHRSHGGHGFAGRSLHHGRTGHVFPAHGTLHPHGKFGRDRRRAVVSFVPSVFYCCASPVVYSAPVVSAPVVVYTPPALDPAPPVAYPPPAAGAPAPPAAAPVPTVVEYATGRYELRGDGMTIPYVWVWIPNPPPAPPPAPPAAPEWPSSEPAPPAGSGKLYRWTDEAGTTFWTNRPDRVPAPYRPGAQAPKSPAADPS